MAKIIQLDKDLINSIAAGEVIQRPASAVKELVENAIDAGASWIKIHLKNSGKDQIVIMDDGCGMEREDLPICIKKHTTSKIASKADLFNIRTLGFRGEALSSIAAISNLRIQTRQKGNDFGYEIKVEDGVVSNVESVGMPEGTIITVNDLFYNTPARREYLKSNETELRYIIDIVNNLALLNHKVGFILTNNNREIINSPKTEDVLGNIINLYGKDFGKLLVPIESEVCGFKIYGFIGKPSLNRSDRNLILTFVNGRFIKNKFLKDAIYDGYQNLLNTGRNPVCILKFEFDPSEIDVNVHPTKELIRFKDEDEIRSAITEIVKGALEARDLVPRVNLAQLSICKEPTQKEVRKELPKHRPIDVVASNQMNLSEVKEYPFKILGTIHKTYIIIETDFGLRLLDQHAAHERIRFEKIRDKSAHVIKKQALLCSITIDLNASDFQLANEYKEILDRMGFEFEEFGKSTIILRTLPSLLGRQLDKTMFLNVVEDIRSKKKLSIEKLKEDLMHTMACRSAIKAGDTIELNEQYKLVEDLLNCKQPHCCPHGRPTMVDFTLDDLEKAFNRKRGYESELDGDCK